MRFEWLINQHAGLQARAGGHYFLFNVKGRGACHGANRQQNGAHDRGDGWKHLRMVPARHTERNRPPRNTQSVSRAGRTRGCPSSIK